MHTRRFLRRCRSPRQRPGLGPLHFGTDGGGSIRIPAGFTGVVGIKPSFGRVPAYPSSPFGTVAHIGPITRTVADAALMLTALSESDARDWYALPHDAIDYRAELGGNLAGLRVAFSPTLGGHKVDPEIAAWSKQPPNASKSWVPGRAGRAGPTGLWPDLLHLWFAGAAHMLEAYSDEQRAVMDPGFLRISAEAPRPVFDYLAAMRGGRPWAAPCRCFTRLTICC